MSAVLFGASTPLAKIAVSSADPIVVAGLLYLGSGIGLAVLRTVRAESLARRTETPLSRADLPWLAGATLAGGVAGPTLLLLGLLTTQASTASLLLNLEAVATAAIAWLIFRENVDMRVGTGFMLIILGGILLSLPRDDGIAISGGALLIAAACLCWGIDNNLTRRISGSDPSQIAMWKGLTAGFVNIGLAFAMGAKFPQANVALGVTTIGFFGYGISLVLFVRALRHLGAATNGRLFLHRAVRGRCARLCPRRGSARLGLLRRRPTHAHRRVAARHRTARASNMFMNRRNTNIFTITTSIISTEHSPADPPGATSYHRHQHVGWRIPTRTIPTPIIVTIIRMRVFVRREP